VAGVLSQAATTLTGFAVLPADTFADGPPSGAWLDAKSLGTPRFDSQPVQGISALWPAGGDDWWALSDNGFGAKANSSDYLLRIYRLSVKWGSGAQPGVVSMRSFVQLADPDRKLPFPITRELTVERWLTGADLDPESLVVMPDGTLWMGDEFGPFLLHFTADGRLLDPPYEVTDAFVRSPDHPQMPVPDAGGRSFASVKRSRGFEGLAYDGRHLYALLEAPPISGPDVYEFDLGARAFTKQMWRMHPLSEDHARTEFVALATLAPECASRFLLVHRDNGHGRAAKIKRVLEVQLTGNSVVSQVVADLLHVANPDALGGHGAWFTFPFITTEAIWPISRTEIILANDNNFPAGGGRPAYARDPTEFIRLKLPAPLCSW
jgi:glycerophosphoryl diester phosphodiesterase